MRAVRSVAAGEPMSFFMGGGTLSGSGGFVRIGRRGGPQCLSGAVGSLLLASARGRQPRSLEGVIVGGDGTDEAGWLAETTAPPAERVARKPYARPVGNRWRKAKAW